MSDFVVDRELITKEVLSLLKEKTQIKLFPELWWRNLRKNGGLSLTQNGDEAFRLAELEYWDKKLEDKRNHSELSLYLLLDKKIPCPYYYMRKGKDRILRVYDSRVATTLLLWNDIDGLLNSMSYRKNI